MLEIRAPKVLFIKLGEGGKFERECIEEKQTLRLDYRGANHDLCLKKGWKTLHEYFMETEGCNRSTATNHMNQIRQFYQEDNTTLWMTFYGNYLWWCFSEPNIYLLPDSTKERQVIGKWSNTDIYGNALYTHSINGKVLKIQGFRGTICSVAEASYLLNKINGKKPLEIIEAEEALVILKRKIAKVVQHLQWKDFEVLVDLIFRQAGWNRVSQTGKTQKTFDLELLSPVTNERALVQVKSQSTVGEFKEYVQRFDRIKGYHKLFYVAHTAKSSLSAYVNKTPVTLLLTEQIAELVISSGLVTWTLQKGM